MVELSCIRAHKEYLQLEAELLVETDQLLEINWFDAILHALAIGHSPKLNFMSTHKVGIIIPALNEDEYISQVLDVVCSVDWVNQIVVVNDGSIDNT